MMSVRRTIAQIAAASADKAMALDRKANADETNIHGLIESVEGFEASHPQLVAVVNEFATVLSSMGV